MWSCCDRVYEDSSTVCVACKKLRPNRTHPSAPWRKILLWSSFAIAAVLFIGLIPDHTSEGNKSQAVAESAQRPVRSRVIDCAQHPEECTSAGSGAPPRNDAVAPDASLPAAAGCSAGEVWIENRSSDVWEQTRIEVNGVWEYQPGAVIPGKQPYMAQLFTRGDGTRLNLITVDCRRIDIHATVAGQRRHWNGARR